MPDPRVPGGRFTAWLADGRRRAQSTLLGALGRRTGLRGTGVPAARRHPGTAPALLALHGFGATPRELDPIVDVAVELGLAVSAPLLPGHGTNLERFASTGWDDWYRAAECELGRLREDSGAPVIVAGLSLGSLLALHLAAARRREVRALVLLSPPTRLVGPWPDWVLAAFAPWAPRWLVLPKGQPDVLRHEARQDQLGYRGNPLRAAGEVRRAGRRALSLLGSIRCPTLVVQGQHDHVCRPDNATEILRKLGSADKHAVLLGRTAHLVTRDYDSERVTDSVRDFLRRLAQ